MSKVTGSNRGAELKHTMPFWVPGVSTLETQDKTLGFKAGETA